MPHGKYKRSFALSKLITTLIKEAVLIAVLVWLLPHFGLNVPAWLSIVILLACAGWSYLTYRIEEKMIDKKPAVGPETMVGSVCRTTTRLCPEGYAQAGTELWRAFSVAGDINVGVEVVVVGVKGLALFVALLAHNNSAKGPDGGESNSTGNNF